MDRCSACEAGVSLDSLQMLPKMSDVDRQWGKVDLLVRLSLLLRHWWSCHTISLPEYGVVVLMVINPNHPSIYLVVIAITSVFVVWQFRSFCLLWMWRGKVWRRVKLQCMQQFIVTKMWSNEMNDRQAKKKHCCCIVLISIVLMTQPVDAEAFRSSILSPSVVSLMRWEFRQDWRRRILINKLISSFNCGDHCHAWVM